ncbi:LacI family DNA-binding transcriptional regulator [Kocuria sp.]|uniref:LacI family DNA-binding transcriptional regulator n=1 Tax=Kocuria sp. TaxID=1871328 RepID=UPI0026DC74AA|nr:LacI family DNA-binding transcriptional regulator [Kocuria sp.]MDO4918895.1 LacI family DNA-binding transcriptional regulator [Kocuria sp.]
MHGHGTPARRATSADVARLAGVSRATVSFVLNDTPSQSISEATRTRVLDAARSLSYTPSAEARALGSGRSTTVLVYLPPARSLTEDIGDIVERLSVLFAEAGLSMVIHAWTRRPAARVWSSVTPAAVLAWDLTEHDAARMRGSGVRGVVSWTGSDAMGRWITGAREQDIARVQVQRLTRAGHHRLGYAVTGGDHMHGVSQWRYEMLRRECASRGLPEPDVLHVPADPLGASEVLEGWRGRNPDASGVCAHDTTAALAVLCGMRRLGWRAPRDLAIVGVNDSPAAALADPPLTMVALDADVTARYTVAVITALVRDAPPPEAPATGGASIVDRGSV